VAVAVSCKFEKQKNAAAAAFTITRFILTKTKIKTMIAEVNTPEFMAIRAQIDALLKQRAQVAAKLTARRLELTELQRPTDTELLQLQANFRALQCEITDLAASVWVSYKKTPSEFIEQPTRIL
jgi:hypothetical protein